MREMAEIVYSDRCILWVHSHSVSLLHVHCLLTVQNGQEWGRNM